MVGEHLDYKKKKKKENMLRRAVNIGSYLPQKAGSNLPEHETARAGRSKAEQTALHKPKLKT